MLFLTRTRLIQLRKKYEELVSRNAISADPRQVPVIELLEQLGTRLETRGVTRPSRQMPASSSYGGFASWLGIRSTTSMTSPTPTAAHNGLYIYGGCGTGKTMLMDMFYKEIDYDSKRRIHFHEFMLDVHARMHAIQKTDANLSKCNTTWTSATAEAQRLALSSSSQTAPRIDPITQIATQIFDETKLLCFDEFQVTFISDAIIMRRLFSQLFDKGIAIVATSNRPPEDLYLNGLNRELFVPFIPLLKEYCTVHNMDSGTDYRQLTTGDDSSDEFKVVFQSNDELERKFFRLVKNECDSLDLNVQGRCVSVRRAAINDPIALFSFNELCDRPLGSADYITIAKRFHTVFIENVPILHIMDNRDLVRRFITLIDAFYDHHVRLVISTEASDLGSILTIEETIKENSSMDEVFAWDRTLSRLMEMTSVEYQQEHSRKYHKN
jgi:predicted ATPase